MSSKISLNVNENLLKWLDRFTYDVEFSTLSRTDVFQQDLCYYVNLLTEGIFSITQKITYDEFICLIGAFNGCLLTQQTTTCQIKFLIGEYDRYNPEFAENCEANAINKTELLEIVDGFNSMECYALLEYARRLWHKVDEYRVDKKMEELGLTRERFKQAI